MNGAIMKSLVGKKVLIAGASFAGLSTAYWMQKLGCTVTVVEVAGALKCGGTPVDIRDNTVNIVKRMELFDQIWANRLPMQLPQVQNADAQDLADHVSEQHSKDDIEIERDVLLNLIYAAVKDKVEFIFGDAVASLAEPDDVVSVDFKSGSSRQFDLVFGCDGVHSDVRKLCFGPEENYLHFLQAYGSVTILNKLLIPQNTVQMYKQSGKMAVLSAYNNKTDIILMFAAAREIPYDHRDKQQKIEIMLERFADNKWDGHDLLTEIRQADNFYFDKICQIKMPAWTKGRIALVGDAAYCASPAAGRGGSLAIDGACALADAFIKCDGDYAAAFDQYNKSFRPFLEEIQAQAAHFCLDLLVDNKAEAQATP